jgi:hypothetical protein
VLDEFTDLPELLSGTDSEADSKYPVEEILDESDGMPNLEPISDSVDEETDTKLEYLDILCDHAPYTERRHENDDDNALMGSSAVGTTAGVVVVTEGKSRRQRHERPSIEPFLRCGFFVSAIQNAKTTSQQIAPDMHALERNAARVKGADCICLKPVILVVNINGQSCQALHCRQ